MQITKEEKLNLYHAARDNNDPLEIVNAFYKHPQYVDRNIFNEFWTHKICILAERITEAEKELKKCQEKLANLKQNTCS